MKENPLFLVVSEKMDSNKKQDRNEHALIRCSAAVRESIGDSIRTIDLKGDAGTALLNIHKAYADDIKAVRASGKIPPTANMSKIAFVTTDVMERLTKEKNYPFIPVKWSLPDLKTLPMGADPEFLLFEDEKVVRANNILSKSGAIGSDGAMIEVRPDPSPDPLVLVDNIRKIFTNEDLTHSVSKYDWKAGVYHKDDTRDYPIGGHIHIGNPTGISRIPADARRTLFAVVNKILDEMLSLPMIKMDGTDLGRARRSNCQMAAFGTNGYGFYGEWRECDGRLEHRTLSGIWLAHPKLASYVIGTAKAIAEAAYAYVTAEGFQTKAFRHPDISFEDHKRLYNEGFNCWVDIPLAQEFECTRDSGLMANLLNNSRASSINKSFLTRWYKKMQRLETYSRYAQHIDGLYEVLCLTARNLKKLDVNIKHNWVEGAKFII